MDTFERLLEGGGPIRREVRTLITAAQAWIDGRAIRLGAAVAYYGLFAVVPVLLLAVALASIFIDEATVTAEVQAALTDLVGRDAAGYIVDAFGEFATSDPGLLVSLIGLGALLFSATLLFVAWKDVVDIMWDAPRVHGARGTIQRRLFGVLAVVGSGVLLTLRLMVDAVFGVLDRFFESRLIDLVLTTTGNVLPLVLGAFFIGVLYKYTPDVEVRWSSVWLASIVTMIMLAIGSWAYGLYLSAFGIKSASGVAGSLFLGLVLVYYAAMILLYGMEIVKLKEIGTVPDSVSLRRGRR